MIATGSGASSSLGAVSRVHDPLTEHGRASVARHLRVRLEPSAPRGGPQSCIRHLGHARHAARRDEPPSGGCPFGL